MSVTFGCHEAPSELRRVPCDSPEMGLTCTPEDRCGYCDDGMMDEWVTEVPQVNLANANARSVLALLGLSTEEWGTVAVADIPAVLQRCLVVLARESARAHLVCDGFEEGGERRMVVNDDGMPEHDAVVVHGGVLPTWDKLDATDKGMVSRLLRVRHVRGTMERKITIEFTIEGDGTFNIPELVKRATSAVPVREQRKNKGDFISLGEEGPDDPFWADVYDGRFGHVYFGHSPFPQATEPVQFPYATGLDLGAVFGGRLAAAILEEGQEPRFVSVPASGKFATSFWEE